MVARVYRHFGMALDHAAAERVSRAAARHPNGGYGHHAYRFEDHGLDPAAEAAKFGAYMQYFGIAPEPPGPRNAGSAGNQ